MLSRTAAAPSDSSYPSHAAPGGREGDIVKHSVVVVIAMNYDRSESALEKGRVIPDNRGIKCRNGCEE